MEGHACGYRLRFVDIETCVVGEYLGPEGRVRSATLLPLFRIVGRDRPGRLLGVHEALHFAAQQTSWAARCFNRRNRIA